MSQPPIETLPTNPPANSADRPLTIVVAEDEPAIRLVLANKLKQAGYSVRVAANGLEGLALVRAAMPDLIITDFQMPRMDGLAMARELHRDEATRRIPLIVLSARGHRLGGADLEGTSVDQVLLKPFSMREVLTIVGDLLGAPRVATPTPSVGPDHTQGLAA